MARQHNGGTAFARLLMVGAPIVILGATWWNLRRPDANPKPPPDWRVGLPRAEVNGWRVVSATPSEAARGLTAKVECDLWHLGDIPLPGRKWRTRSIFYPEWSTLYLAYREGNLWRRLVLPDGTGGVRMAGFERALPKMPTGQDPFPSDRYDHGQLWLPVGLLPADATDVMLSGTMCMAWLENKRKMPFPASLKNIGDDTGGHSWRFHAKTHPLRLELGSLPGWQARPGEMGDVSQESNDAFSKLMVRNVPQGVDWDCQAGDAVVDYRFRERRRLLSRRPVVPHIDESRVVDAAGRTYLPRADKLRDLNINCLNSGMVMGSGDGATNHEILPLWRIPASAGPLTLKLWVSTGNGESPVLIQREVRPAWLLRRASHLKVQSVHFSTVRGVLGSEKYSLDIIGKKAVVDVTLLYSGAKKPLACGYVRRADSGRPLWIPYVYYKPPGSENAFDGVPIKPAAGEPELLLNWSQRLTDARGQSLKVDSPQLDNSKTRIQTEAPHGSKDGRLWKVRYYIPARPKTKTPLWFRAEVGIVGEGFIPVSCPVPLN